MTSIEYRSAFREITDVDSLDVRLRRAVKRTFGNYGIVVSVDQKNKSLFKFGGNPSVGAASTRYTLWATGADQANETYPAANTNPIDSISSATTEDTEAVIIEGHTAANDQLTFVVQTATLNGQNRVALSTPLHRMTRVAHANQSSTPLVGPVYGYQNTALSSGKPVDTTKIHITVSVNDQQSEKASTSISNSDIWLIDSIYAGYKTKSGSNTADVRIEIREYGGVFRPVAAPIIISTGTALRTTFSEYVIVPPNADVRLTAIASASGQFIVGDIQGILAKIVTE